MIIFEHILRKNEDGSYHTVGVSPSTSGKYYPAMLSALINSSNLSPNADRGQDFGYRLQPEQQAIIEEWENDPEMIEKVSAFTKVQVDDLTHSEFLHYLSYQQNAGKSAERKDVAAQRQAEADYEKRVAELKAAKAQPIAPFGQNKPEATVENFLSGELTGDAGGDKVADPDVGAAAPLEAPKKKK